MSDGQVILLEISLVGGGGLLLTIAGILIRIFEKKKSGKCGASVVGHVIDYKYNGNGGIFPVVSYEVDGNSYTIIRRFRGIITKTKITPTKFHQDSGAYVNRNDYLVVPMSAITNFRKMAEELWPIGSEMVVYYNPDSPKCAYAEKLPSAMSFVSIMFIGMGIFTILLSFFGAFLITL